MANSGVFNIDDINFLKDNQQYPTLGQLELIEYKNITTGTTAIDFLNIKEDIYDVHFLTWNNAVPGTDQKTLTLRVSDDNGSTFESGSNYDIAFINGNANGTAFTENKSVSFTYMYCSTSVGNATGESANGYAYLYDLGDSNKYAYQMWHCVDMQAAPVMQMFMGAQQYGVAATYNAIRLAEASATSTWTGNFGLYGLRFT